MLPERITFARSIANTTDECHKKAQKAQVHSLVCVLCAALRQFTIGNRQ
jgi:hypothetical protein